MQYDFSVKQMIGPNVTPPFDEAIVIDKGRNRRSSTLEDATATKNRGLVFLLCGLWPCRRNPAFLDDRTRLVPISQGPLGEDGFTVRRGLRQWTNRNFRLGR
jgi:hypothetical protein